MIARAEKSDITIRELRELMIRQNVTSQEEALEELVRRRVLAVEAEKRGLEQNGEFHFALRNAREELLVEALRVSLRSDIEPVTDADIARELNAHPWRYSGRSLAVLADQDNPESTITVDTADFPSSPPSALFSTPVGETLVLGDRDWRIVSRRDAPLSADEARAYAASNIEERQVDNALEQILDNYRHSGRIRYQPGWGAATAPIN